MKFALHIVFVLLLFADKTFCQETIGSDYGKSKPFILGTIEEIRSNVLNEKRVLNIYLPKDIIKMILSDILSFIY